MSYKPMTKKDKEFFQSIGVIKGRAKSHSLIYIVEGRRETIVDKRDYGLCRYKENECKRMPQFQRGLLIIESNY